MDNLAHHYERRYKQAEDLALAGRNDAALDILWDMRLKADLGVYRRALVNLLLAAIAPSNRRKFAEECLDLVDIIRKENDYTSEQFDNIEAVAAGFIAKIDAPTAVVDPTSGLLSDPTGPPNDEQSSLLSPLKKLGVGALEGGLPATDPMVVDIAQDNTGLQEKAEDEEQPELADDGVGEIIFTYQSNSTVKAPKDTAFFGQRGDESIEGYLRDSYYLPREQKATLTLPVNVKTAAAKARERLPTPAPSDPAAGEL